MARLSKQCHAGQCEMHEAMDGKGRESQCAGSGGRTRNGSAVDVGVQSQCRKVADDNTYANGSIK
jgi:hypothetical protein